MNASAAAGIQTRATSATACSRGAVARQALRGEGRRWRREAAAPHAPLRARHRVPPACYSSPQLCRAAWRRGCPRRSSIHELTPAAKGLRFKVQLSLWYVRSSTPLETGSSSARKASSQPNVPRWLENADSQALLRLSRCQRRERVRLHVWRARGTHGGATHNGSAGHLSVALLHPAADRSLPANPFTCP